MASMTRSAGIANSNDNDAFSPARRATDRTTSVAIAVRQRFRSLLPMSLKPFRECSLARAYLITAVVVVAITIVFPECLALVRNF
ncbi:MAG: hypothetical protein K4304_06935 [Propionicimonas sp.]